MNIDGLTSVACRILLGAAFLLLAIALLERIAFTFGYTITGEAFSGGRLLETASAILLFAIALLLRQIREQLKHSA